MATGLLCVLAVAVPSSMRPPSWLPVAPVTSPLVPMAAGLWCVLAAAAARALVHPRRLDLNHACWRCHPRRCVVGLTRPFVAAYLEWQQSKAVVVPVASPLVPMTTKFSVAAQAT